MRHVKQRQIDRIASVVFYFFPFFFMHLKKAIVSAVSTALVSGFALSSVAFADTIYNSVDASVDASIETLNLSENGAATSVDYKVVATNTDGFAGCNLSASGALTVSLESSDPAVATVSPSTLTFTNCADVKTVTVTPHADGHADITLSQQTNLSAGSFNLSASTFKAVVVSVSGIDTTPPVITSTVSPTSNAQGWHTSDVTVSWTVTDPESAIVTKTGCDTKTQTKDTWSKVFTCTATSAGGTSTKSVTVKLDKTDPSVRIFSPMNGATFEQNDRVIAKWFAFDLSSKIATSTGTVASGKAIDTSTLGSHTFNVTATDRAGNQKVVSVTYTVVADNDDEDDDDDHDHDHHGRFGKATICHKGKHSISIGTPALKAHLKHEDRIGACDND